MPPDTSEARADLADARVALEVVSHIRAAGEAPDAAEPRILGVLRDCPGPCPPEVQALAWLHVAAVRARHEAEPPAILEALERSRRLDPKLRVGDPAVLGPLAKWRDEEQRCARVERELRAEHERDLTNGFGFSAPEAERRLTQRLRAVEASGCSLSSLRSELWVWLGASRHAAGNATGAHAAYAQALRPEPRTAKDFGLDAKDLGPEFDRALSDALGHGSLPDAAGPLEPPLRRIAECASCDPYERARALSLLGRFLVDLRDDPEGAKELRQRAKELSARGSAPR